MNQKSSVTQLLAEWSAGNQSVLDELFPLVYDELRRTARNYLRRENAAHTLQPTALVHEAFLRLTDQRQVQWQNRAHFFAIAAKMMRRVLVNYAESKHAEKRGGSQQQKIELDEALAFCEQRNVDLLALDEALNKLGELDPQLCQIVEMKFFSGLTNEEVAEVLNISVATVKREWATAKTWLLREISQ
ncbi:MAG: sigma-70 family RNA polymerase sigma factor [Acidobacteriota bacterium]|nr:sigma-70 family RNA polymerase sigma factor [Acidobacteriota bacterium]